MNDGRPYDESPEQRRHIRDAIDACRPAPSEDASLPAEHAGSADLRDFDQPELEFLAAHLEAHPEDRQRLESVQKFDRQIRAQLADVPVPEGLADRLLAGLQQESGDQNAPLSSEAFDEAVSAEPVSQGVIRPADQEKPTRGLKWWVGIAVAASIFVLLSSLLQPSPPLNIDDVHTAALNWANQQAAIQFAADNPEELQRLTEKFPQSSLVSARRTGANPLKNFLGRNGMAYSFTSQNGAQATLLVVQTGKDEAIADIPIGKPSNHPYNTAGLSLLVWRENELLYVLVVPDDQGFRQFMEDDLPIAYRWIPARTFA